VYLCLLSSSLFHIKRVVLYVLLDQALTSLCRCIICYISQERFRTITTSYYRSADAIMLCFGLNDSTSFAHCEAWMEDVRLYSGKDVTIELIGNKCDLVDERVVDFKEAKAYAERNGFMYEETSAKTRINVDRALTRLTQAVYDKKKEKINATRPTTANNTNESKNVQLQSTNPSTPASSCPC
jgi:GTPase SAR1 family protein